jgi:hypothetical protein
MAIVDGLITLTDAKSQLGIPSTVTTYDDDLELYVEAATPIIEQRTGPVLQKTRTFTLSGGRAALLLPRFASVTSFQIGGLDRTDYVASGEHGIIYAGTTDSPSIFDGGTNNITVTVVVGAATVPYNVQLATRELVRHWWQQGRQANRPGTADDVVAQPLPLGVSNRIDELLMPNRSVAGFA